MNIHCVRLLAAALILAALLTPTFAGDPPPEEQPPLDLAKAVVESQIDLRFALIRSEVKQCVPLRAAFAYDRVGQLVLRVLLRSAPDGDVAYEEWTGPVQAESWSPRRRVIADAGELAAAKRLSDLIGSEKRVLVNALAESKGELQDDRTWPHFPISVEPTLENEEPRLVSLVVMNERVQRVTQARDTAKILSMEPTDALPPRVEVDPESKTRTLPELTVPDGIWFNTDEPVTLGILQGSPVLIEIADPG